MTLDDVLFRKRSRIALLAILLLGLLVAPSMALAPIANFSADPTSGACLYVNSEDCRVDVQFTDLSENLGLNTTWYWESRNDLGYYEFESFSTDQNPYTPSSWGPGAYSIRLTVTNDEGSNTSEKIGFLNFTEGPPWEFFTGDDFETGGFSKWGTVVNATINSTSPIIGNHSATLIGVDEVDQALLISLEAEEFNKVSLDYRFDGGDGSLTLSNDNTDDYIPYVDGGVHHEEYTFASTSDVLYVLNPTPWPVTVDNITISYIPPPPLLNGDFEIFPDEYWSPQGDSTQSDVSPIGGNYSWHINATEIYADLSYWTPMRDYCHSSFDYQFVGSSGSFIYGDDNGVYDEIAYADNEVHHVSHFGSLSSGVGFAFYSNDADFRIDNVVLDTEAPVVTITGLSPNRGLNGTTAHVTVTGTGFPGWDDLAGFILIDAPTDQEATDLIVGYNITVDPDTQFEVDFDLVDKPAANWYVELITSLGGGGPYYYYTEETFEVYDAEPPVADFECTPLEIADGGTTVCTDLSTNTPTSWLWEYSRSDEPDDWGGGYTDQNPEIEINTGGGITLNIRLTASNDYGSDNETKTDYITVIEPPLITLTATDPTTAANNTIIHINATGTNFTQGTVEGFGLYNESTSTGIIGTNVTVTSPTTLEADLDLTDGGAFDFPAGIYRSYIGAEPEFFGPDFTVTAPAETPPEANFVVDNSSIPKLPGRSAQFNDTSTGSPDSWTWSFGDGSANVTTQNVTHRYSRPGYFTVGVTATTAAGSSSSNSHIWVI
jgi:PKD repeat protein